MRGVGWPGWLSTVCRLALAAVWLLSGAIKAVDPLQTEVAVRAYQVLPEPVVGPVATTLPFLEIGLGLLLLLGVGVRAVALASVLLLGVFLVGVGSSWARGLSIDCGCFGGGGAADVGPLDYLAEIARDAGFVVLALWLVARPWTLLAIGPGSRTSTGLRPVDDTGGGRRA